MKPSDTNLKSEQELRNEVARGSQCPEIFCRLAEIVFAAGRKEEALSLYHRALSSSRTELQKARVSTELGWLLYEIGKATEALPLARTAAEALSNAAETPEVYALRGASEALQAHCIWSTDERAATETARSALEYLNRVIIDAPDFDDIGGVYYEAARLSNLLQNAKDAVMFCEKCLQHDLSEEEQLQCLVVLAEALRYDERFAEAEKVLEQAFTLAKTDTAALARLYLELGMVKRLTNRLKEARHSLEQALTNLESHPYFSTDPHFLTLVCGNLGELYCELKEYEGAVAAFQKVIQSRPNDDIERREALRWLGQTYHVIENHAAARDCYEEVLNSPLASAVEKASVEKGLGKLHCDAGEYEKAIVIFESLLRRFPEANAFHRDVLLWLGYSYRAAGSDDKARDCFEKILASEQASEAEKDSAQEWLSSLPPAKGIWH